jgi:hypothetical protein
MLDCPPVRTCSQGGLCRWGFHTAVLYSPVPQGLSAYTNLAAQADEVLDITNSHFRSLSEVGVFAAFTMGPALLDRVRLTTPSLRATAPSSIRPINQSSPAPSDPNVATFVHNPITILRGEEMVVEAMHNTVGAQDVYAVLFMARRLDDAPSGPVVTLRGSSTTSAPTQTWTDVTVTWDSVPPKGTFAVLGCEVVTTNPCAFRLRLLEPQGFRPGGISQSALNGKAHALFRDAGALGEWGRFDVPAMPRVQIYPTLTSASHTIFLQVVRVA